MVRNAEQLVCGLFLARVSRMRRVLRHIQGLRERNGCVELLATHGGVVEPLQVDDQDARKPVNCQILLHIHLFFTAIASEACVDHLLRLDKLVQAVSYFY